MRKWKNKKYYLIAGKYRLALAIKPFGFFCWLMWQMQKKLRRGFLRRSSIKILLNHSHILLIWQTNAHLAKQISSKDAKHEYHWLTPTSLFFDSHHYFHAPWLGLSLFPFQLFHKSLSPLSLDVALLRMKIGRFWRYFLVRITTITTTTKYEYMLGKFIQRL